MDVEAPVGPALDKFILVPRPDLVAWDLLKLWEPFSTLRKKHKSFPVPVHALADRHEQLSPIMPASSHIAQRIPNILQPGGSLIARHSICSVIHGVPGSASPHAEAAFLSDRFFGLALVKNKPARECRYGLAVTHGDERIHAHIWHPHIRTTETVAACCVSKLP